MSAMDSVNWDYLRVFLLVARAGSVTAAARQSGLSHATVIRKLERLEEMLETRLFDHGYSGYTLTLSGASILEQVERMEAAVIDTLRRVKGEEGRLEGTLRIAQPEGAFIDLSPVLASFRAAHPKIILEISATPRIANLNRHDADIAIRLTNVPPENMIGRQIGAVEFSAYAARSYLAGRGPDTAPAALDWAMWTGAEISLCPAVRYPDKILMELLDGPNVAMRSDSMGEVVAAVRAGMGVGLIAKATAALQPDLVELPMPELLNRGGLDRAGLWVLTHPDIKGSRRVQAFISHVVEHYLGHSDFMRPASRRQIGN